MDGGGSFVDLQAFGNSLGKGKGELWVYGNLFRNDLSAPSTLPRFWNNFCGTGTGDYHVYFFNNTFDLSFTGDGIYQVCNDSGALIVEQNNAYWNGSTSANPHASIATETIREHEYCSASSADCTVPSKTGRKDWWDYSTPSSDDGTKVYAAKEGGPLDGAGNCDPDGDGTNGVDYNGDGSNDLQWCDAAGKLVDCSSAGKIDVGALQSSDTADGDCEKLLENNPGGVSVADSGCFGCRATHVTLMAFVLFFLTGLRIISYASASRRSDSAHLLLGELETV